LKDWPFDRLRAISTQLRSSVGDLERKKGTNSALFESKWLARLDNCKNLLDSFQYKSKSLKTKPSSKVKKKSPPGPHPLHIAKEFQNQLEASSVNKAELARRYGMSRARVTQIINLLKLSPEIREEILNLPDKKKSFFTEKKLRKIVRLSPARKQILSFEHLKSCIE
jgi:hypothetical protein